MHDALPYGAFDPRPAAETTDLTVRRRGHTVLHQVSITVAASGVTVLGGPDGAATSTLLACLGAMRAPDEGDIAVLGTHLDERTAVPWVRRNIGYLPAEPTAPPDATLDDLFGYSAWLARLEGHELARAVAGATARAGLDEPGGRKLRRLSDGQRRRAFVAAAAIADPALLLLDEPTAALDEASRREVRTQLRHLSVGRAVVVASSLTDDLDSLADEVIIVVDGRVTFTGPRERFLQAAAAGTGRYR